MTRTSASRLGWQLLWGLAAVVACTSGVFGQEESAPLVESNVGGVKLPFDVAPILVGLVVLVVLPFISMFCYVPGFWIASRFLCDVPTFGNALKTALYLAVVSVLFTLMSFFSGMQGAAQAVQFGDGTLDPIQLIFMLGFALVWLLVFLNVPMEIYAITGLRAIGYWLVAIIGTGVLVAGAVYGAVSLGAFNEEDLTADRMEYYNRQFQEMVQSTDTWSGHLGISRREVEPKEGEEEEGWKPQVGKRAVLVKEIWAKSNGQPVALPSGAEVELLKEENKGLWTIRYHGIEGNVPYFDLAPPPDWTPNGEGDVPVP